MPSKRTRPHPDVGVPPPWVFISVDSKGVKVLCFHVLLQVLIPEDLHCTRNCGDYRPDAVQENDVPRGLKAKTLAGCWPYRSLDTIFPSCNTTQRVTVCQGKSGGVKPLLKCPLFYSIKMSPFLRSEDGSGRGAGVQPGASQEGNHALTCLRGAREGRREKGNLFHYPGRRVSFLATESFL
jgi:hypothetical protein